MALKLRLGKSKKSGIGGKRVDGIRPQGIKRGAKLRHRSKDRVKEQSVLNLIYELTSQEVKEAGFSIAWNAQPDHIFGRHDPKFDKANGGLTALLDPENIQWITPREHELKTDAVEIRDGITQRHDFRPKAVIERMIAVKARIVKRLGPVWDLSDLKKAIELEIWAK